MANRKIGRSVWYADDTGYIALDLSDIPHQESRTIEGAVLSAKDEHHCSLVAVRKYVEDPAEEQRVADAVKDYLRGNNLRFVGLGDERYLCRKDDRRTIVAPVRIDGVDELFAFVQTLIPEYVPPFLHVTLLKSQTAEHGISVNSSEDLHRYCERLMEGEEITVPTSAYGMHYDTSNAKVIARAQAVSEDKWKTLPIETLPARMPLNASFETVLRRYVERVVSGQVPLRGGNYPTKLWRDDARRLYIVDGHVRTAIYYALNMPMPVRIMDEKLLAELGGDDDHDLGDGS